MARKNRQPNVPTGELKKEVPFDNVDHKAVILSKNQVKERNEVTKDYSKILNKRMGRGPGHGVYLGKNATNRGAVIKRIWNYLGIYRYGLIIIVIAILLTSLLSIYIPTLLAQTIDAISEGNFDNAVTYALYIVIIAVIYGLIRFISKFVMVNVSQKTIKRIRKEQ